MRLAAIAAKYPDELRADLQRYYGIDFDHARAGGHTAHHVAALIACLPTGSALQRAESGADGEWTLEAVILADLRNMFASYVWCMSDPKKRGSRPKRIGPSWMRDKPKTLECRVLSISDLMTELSKPRR